MTVFKCKMCGGTLEFTPNNTVAVCDSCGTKQTLPKLDDDRRANLYDRANHFRRNNEFDKAEGIYEQILNEDNTDAEAYWSLVLCHYGIEYVEDPAMHRRVPTVNRAQFTSIFDDANYKSALQYANAAQREVYEAEADTINEIQKGILSISQKEEPFDVFICYKETDEHGRRTQDSVLANELYYELTREGFKVFFSRITLEDKLGTAYEPYIFAALNSAKVMVVIGTKPEYFNAVWVKNEWSRYLALIKSGAKKILIPAYRDMDPYNLPEEFSHLQAQDMGKLGFMQDLIRGIKKLTESSMPREVVRETVVVNGGNVNVSPLLKRAFLFLEDGNWQEADAYCEKVLDQDPECAEAYLGKLMAELKVRVREELKDHINRFEASDNYRKALRFAGEKDKFFKDIQEAKMEQVYTEATEMMNTATGERAYKKAAAIFETILAYKDAAQKRERCLKEVKNAETESQKDEIYNIAMGRMREYTISGYMEAIERFEEILGWKDADEQKNICEKRLQEMEKTRERSGKNEIYNSAIEKMRECIIPSYMDAIERFEKISGWRDSDEQKRLCEKKIEEIREREERRRLEKEYEEERLRAAERKEDELNRRAAKYGIIILFIICILFLFLIMPSL